MKRFIKDEDYERRMFLDKKKQSFLLLSNSLEQVPIIFSYISVKLQLHLLKLTLLILPQLIVCYSITMCVCKECVHKENDIKYYILLKKKTAKWCVFYI